MDKTFKVGDKVRFKTREQIKIAATSVSETYVNGKLDEYCYEFPSGFSFINEMEHLCGVEAYITDIAEDSIKLNKFSKYSPYKDYCWTYTPEMVELVEEDKPQYDQMSFEALDEFRDKLANLKPKQKAIDIQIKCLEKVCSDLEKELDEACKEFEEFKNEGINSIKEAKIAVEELKKYI